MFLYQLWCLHIVNWFPGVIALQVPFPLDEVLEFALSVLMGLNGLNLVLYFAFDHVRWWPHEVLTVFFCFDVGYKDHLFYLEGSMPSRG